MSTRPGTFLTPGQYLEIERKAEYKSAILRGRNVRDVRRQPRVRVTHTGLYTYPDVIAVCGQPRFIDDTMDTLVNPTFLAGVLSLSTEACDSRPQV